MKEFQTKKNDLTQSRIIDSDTPAIDQGEVLVKIDKFAFTANNITYAVMGDQLRYWQFFPPNGEQPDDWGIIPVWGFADVIESNCGDLPIGERLFGYFPPAHFLKLTPSKISNGGIFDASAHRSHLPPAYNSYRRVLAEPQYNSAMDDERMLLFVLHLTSFCIQDQFRSHDWYGAEQLVIISASSKTSTGLAYGLDADETAPHVIGLTSKRNIDLVNSLNVYDSTHTYDDLSDIDASKPTAIVDMSGDSRLLSELHTHLGDNMRFCCNVGLTHWDEPQQAQGIIQERSEMFFAPSHIQQRMIDWGHEEFDKRSIAYIMHSCAKSRSWMKMTELNGVEGLAEVYAEVCAGHVAPDEGLIIKM